MRNAISHQGNKKLNYNEQPIHIDLKSEVAGRELPPSTRKYVDHLELTYTAGGHVIWYNLFGTSVWRFLKKFMQLPHDPDIPFLSIWPREINICIHTKKLYANVHSSITRKSQKVEAIQMFVNW